VDNEDFRQQDLVISGVIDECPRSS